MPDALLQMRGAYPATTRNARLMKQVRSLVNDGKDGDAWALLRDKSVERAAYIRRRMKAATRDVRLEYYDWKAKDEAALLKVYEQAYAQTAERIVNQYDPDSRARQKALLGDLERVIRDTEREQQAHTMAAVRKAADYGQRGVWVPMIEHLPPGSTLYGPASPLWGATNERAVRAAMKADTTVWSRRIWRHRDNAREGMQKQIAVGVAQGRSTDEIVRAVRGYMVDPQRTDRYFKGVRTRARKKRKQAQRADKMAQSHYERARLAAERGGSRRHINTQIRLAQSWEGKAKGLRRDASRLYRSAKAIDIIPEKGLYRSWFQNARRLVREETNRAYREGFLQGARQFERFVYHKWELSAGHPKPDICDAYAAGGDIGGGVYTASNVPLLPHIGCMCYTVPVVRWDKIGDGSKEAV